MFFPWQFLRWQVLQKRRRSQLSPKMFSKVYGKSGGYIINVSFNQLPIFQEMQSF